MAQWKRRRPAEHQAAEVSREDTESLRHDLRRQGEEIQFLRAQLTQALTGWREAQQQIFALEAVPDSAAGEKN